MTFSDQTNVTALTYTGNKRNIPRLMARRRITQELYDKLLVAFRAAPGNYKNAGKVAGCDQRASKRGWEKGWTMTYGTFRPIHDVLEEEGVAARAAKRKVELEDMARATRDRSDAKDEAIQTLSEEGRMLKIVRTNVIGQQAIANSLLGTMKTLADTLKHTIAADPKALTPKDTLGALKLFAHVHRLGAEAADKLIAADRRSRGEPVEVLGIQAIPDLTLEEAKHRVNLAAKAINRMQEKGKETIH